MSSLLIHKIGNSFFHVDSLLTEFPMFLGDFWADIENDKFQLNRYAGSSGREYNFTDVTIQVDSGSIENFTAREDLTNRLKEISYPGIKNFSSGGATPNLPQVLAVGPRQRVTINESRPFQLSDTWSILVPTLPGIQLYFDNTVIFPLGAEIIFESLGESSADGFSFKDGFDGVYQNNYISWNNFSYSDGTPIPLVKGNRYRLCKADGSLSATDGGWILTYEVGSISSGSSAVTSVNAQTGDVILNSDNIGDGTTYKQYSATEKTKLAGIASGATANSSDATLLARANHTGTQTASTISDFNTQVATTASLKSNNLSDLASASTARTNLGLGTLATQSGTFSAKQDVLVSGTNIKTINSTSLLGTGNLNVNTNFDRYGTIYNKSSWVDISDFTSNAATVSVVSNKLSFSTAGTNIVAGTNSQPGSFLRLNGATGLDRWVMTIKVKVNQVPSTTSYGFFAGVIGDTSLGNTSESAALGFFNMSTTGLTGKVSTVVGTQNNLNSSSSTVLTFSQNDFIELRVERELSNLTVSARNLTTLGGTTSTSFNYNTAFADGTTNPFIPNSGTFVIGQCGGSFIVDDVKVESTTIKRANLMVIGDSKVNYNAPYDLTWGQLLNRKMENVVFNAGPIDITQGVVNKLTEIVALNPKQVVIAIGKNDHITGISSATWQANMVTIDNTLTAAGIAVYWTNMFKETASTTAVRDYINTQFSGRVINTYDATNYANTLSADGIHPSIIGHQQIYEAILASKLLTDYSVNQNLKTASASFQDVRFTGNILAGGGVIARPTTVNPGDILIPDGGALRTCYSTATPTWFGYLKLFDGGITKLANTFSAATKYGIQFIINGGTNGSEVTGMVLSDTGSLWIKPTTTPNPLTFSDAPTSGGFIGFGPGSGIFGQYKPAVGSEVGQHGRFIPFTSTNTTEVRNYSRIGEINTYVSGGTDNSQVLAQKIDSKGSTSFIGDGVQMPNLTTTNRDLIGKVIGGYMTNTTSGVTTASVSFTGGGGSGAAANAVISGGVITGITMTNLGSGYTSAPTISFSGDGNASTAACTLSMSLLRKGLMIYNTTTDTMNYWNGTAWISF